jgi:Transposase DDE domain group 1
MANCIAQVAFRFERKGKPVVARFDIPDASSDGGLVLLKSIDTQLGLTKRLAACVDDARQPAKVRHETIELLRQRVFGLAAGYADCNDAARLADDVIHKLMVGRDPLAGRARASQPTLSRFENAVGRRELIAMGHVLADAVIEHHRRRLQGRATRITIDLDPTDDPTHGQQEFTFFNDHYDTWCYLPVAATVTFNEEVEQFAVAAVLRPDNAPAQRGARGLLRRLLRQLRAAFPNAVLRIRLDGGFARPKLFSRGFRRGDSSPVPSARPRSSDTVLDQPRAHGTSVARGQRCRASQACGPATRPDLFGNLGPDGTRDSLRRSSLRPP